MVTLYNSNEHKNLEEKITCNHKNNRRTGKTDHNQLEHKAPNISC